ncbi:MAG: hypothetical protein ACRDIU_02280 [Actinomycetota bacterium]
MTKQRLTVTVDREIAAAALDAVKKGRASSLSAWVNDALSQKIDKERRLLALAEAIEAYEKEFGAFTSSELLAQERKDAEQAVVVRGRPAKRRGSEKSRSRRGAA